MFAVWFLVEKHSVYASKGTGLGMLFVFETARNSLILTGNNNINDVIAQNNISNNYPSNRMQHCISNFWSAHWSILPSVLSLTVAHAQLH